MTISYDRIAVVGLGAIGGYIAARLAEAGHSVSAVARGETLARVRAHGLLLDAKGVRTAARIVVAEDPAELGAQDLVVVAVKAPALIAVAPTIERLIGADTMILPMMNGVPWWLLPAALPEQPPLASVDPGGRLAGMLPIERVLGCVVHFSAFTPEPGIVQHNNGDHLIIGEARGGESARAQRVCDLFAAAGFRAEYSSDVRRAVWYKLWGNMTMNPLSMITGATTGQLLDDTLVREFVVRTMTEAAAIGARIGCAIDESPLDRMQVTRRLGSFKTSMLRDALAGRPIELDALLTAVQEIGARVEVPTPNIDTLLGIARVHATLRGLYRESPSAKGVATRSS